MVSCDFEVKCSPREFTRSASRDEVKCHKQMKNENLKALQDSLTYLSISALLQFHQEIWDVESQEQIALQGKHRRNWNHLQV